MTPSDEEFSAIEICIAAFFTYLGFFLATLVIQVMARGSTAETVVGTLVAFVAWGYLGHVWCRQTFTRGHVANLALLAVAALVAIDLAGLLVS